MEFSRPFAHTPSFVGSHITGYDGMMKRYSERHYRGQERRAEREAEYHNGL